jgi:hypothetical protein
MDCRLSCSSLGIYSFAYGGIWCSSTFDSDPVGQEESSMRRYQILRLIDDPNYVMIDLKFDTLDSAEDLLAAMRVVWSRVEGTIMMNPQARIVEAVETKEY